jgi:transposase
MLYLGIDQHAMQLTVDLGNETGDLVFHRQVSTKWDSLKQFFAELDEQAASEGGYIAVVEVCGFNNYLLEMLEQQEHCTRVILVQPESRGKKKTDRRDARTLRHLLWVNRERILRGEAPAAFRIVRPASESDAADRQLTVLQKKLTQQRTRIINKIRTLLRKHNLQHDQPTKGIQTKKTFAWLLVLQLPKIDRFEMDQLLHRWKLVAKQLHRVQGELKDRAQQNAHAIVLRSIPGMHDFSSLSVACRIGDIRDFPRSCSLANYWGLTPGARNSGGSRNTLGITKAGSSHVRYVLGQVVLHVLRKDSWMRQWYQKIKRRRGGKVARVAVMRRLATVIWSMITYQIPYQTGGPEKYKELIARHKQLGQQLGPQS